MELTYTIGKKTYPMTQAKRGRFQIETDIGTVITAPTNGRSITDRPTLEVIRQNNRKPWELVTDAVTWQLTKAEIMAILANTE